MSLQADIIKTDGFFVGEDKTIVYTVLNQNDPAHGVVNITGWTIAWELSASYSGPNIFTVSAELALDPTTGVCTADIPADNTVALQGDREYWYTLRRTDTGAHEELAFGTCYLRDVFVDY